MGVDETCGYTIYAITFNKLSGKSTWLTHEDSYRQTQTLSFPERGLNQSQSWWDFGFALGSVARSAKKNEIVLPIN